MHGPQCLMTGRDGEGRGGSQSAALHYSMARNEKGDRELRHGMQFERIIINIRCQSRRTVVCTALELLLELTQMRRKWSAV